MNAMFPKQVLLEKHEMYRINRARLALRLHKMPKEIDAAPTGDILDLIAVMNMDQTIQERRAQQ